MRLDRFLTRQGFGTRSAVRARIRKGGVCVDGVSVTDAARQLCEKTARVAVDGETLPNYRDSMHIMLNKPAGYLTAARDARHRTVMDLLPVSARTMGCMPVGRLDMDTDGLLLFTTDGPLAYRLLSPKRNVEKAYIAHVDAPLSGEDIGAFAAGLRFPDFIALPAKLCVLADGMSARVTVREGKYHQVKRMFAVRGKRVLRLTRVAFAGIPLDAALAPGEWRELTGSEVNMLYAAAERAPRA